MSPRGTLGLMPRTRRGFVFFWTALFMLSIALQYVAAAAPQGALAISGAIYTSNFDGTDVNENLYDSKADVYLTGGPCQGGSHLDEGDYYFQVSNPNAGDLLSTDAIGDRFFSVGANGFISSTSSHLTHAVGCAGVTGITIQLLPYDDTPNPGGEYKLTVATAESVEECPEFEDEGFVICGDAEQKSDNFKVGDNGDLRVVKSLEGGPDGFSGSFEVTIDCGDAGSFDREIDYPDPGYVIIADLPEGAECTVEEDGVPNPPTDYQWLAVTYTNNGAEIEADATVTITVNNTLDFIERPGVSIVKSVSLTGTDGWVDELTVTTGTTVYYRITITNTGNVPLTDVGLSDDKSNLVSKGCAVPTTLAVGAHYDCNYSSVAVTGTTVNTATVITDELPPEADDATVNASQLPTLTIVKTNNAPLSELDLPTADEGDTVTFTLAYSFTGDEVTDATIEDVLPPGLTYVTGSASSDAQFTFIGYDIPTRTLSWSAESVDEGGSVHYDATVDDGAADIPDQPLTNTATIDSEETQEDSDTSDVFVAPLPLAETSVPTPPQTDIGSTESSASAGSMLLVLLALAGIALAVIFVAPTPAAVRKRMDR